MNSKTGEEVFDLKKIAKNYLKGRFWVDVLASLPFDVIGLQMGSNKGASQAGQNFGKTRAIID